MKMDFGLRIKEEKLLLMEGLSVVKSVAASKKPSDYWPLLNELVCRLYQVRELFLD